MMIETSEKIAIAGAGSIGCYVGGCLALAGRNVTLLGRTSLMDMVAQHGMRVTDLEGGDRVLDPGQVEAANDAEVALRNARVVVVSVKSNGTDEMAALVDRFAPNDAVVVSPQNGVRNVERLRAGMRVPRTVVAGIVSFNVVLDATGSRLRVHKGTDGAVFIGSGVQGLAQVLSVEGCEVRESHDMDSVLWGKLLVNLNNALNALSDLPLAQQLSDRRWRKLLAAQMDEALQVMDSAGIHPAKFTAAPAKYVPTILRLPDWLFSRAAGKMLAIDAHARSSMWDDLQSRKLTEVAEFQGAIAELGRKHGIETPLTGRIMALISQAERDASGSPALRPDQIMR